MEAICPVKASAYIAQIYESICHFKERGKSWLEYVNCSIIAVITIS